MEGGGLLHSENNTIGSFTAPMELASSGIQMGEINQKTMPLIGSVMRRKRLSDITNITSTGRAERSESDNGGQENPRAVSLTSSKDYIAQLLKENNALLRLVGERNKILEITGVELQKLKFTLQKANQQNWQLAQANSHMLAELNLGKDRLKALQHELGCTVAVLRARTSELEEEKKLNKQCKQLREKISTEVGRTKPAEVAADPSFPANCKKACNTDRKRTLRSRSLGPTVLTHQESTKEKDAGRRKSLRRRSNNLKAELCEPTEDSFKIEDVKLQICSHEDSSFGPESSGHSTPNAIMDSVKDGVQKDQSVSPRCQDQGSRRSSLGRPMRRAAEKVSSYKEVPVNVKMRRAE